MKRVCLVTAAVVLLAPAAVEAISAYQSSRNSDGGVVLRLDRPMGSVLNPGEEVSLSVQTRENAFVLVFDIDTEGYVHLIDPAPGRAPRRLEARRTYHIPDREGDRLLAGGATGIEFLFAVTVRERDSIDPAELRFLAESDDRAPEDRFRIDGDPFLAANIVAGELIRGISHTRGVYLDYTYFYLNERVDHPCYLCGACDNGRSTDPCPDYAVAAAFDRDTPLTYPLRRAYELATAGGGYDTDVTTGESDESESDDDSRFSRVHVTFYPYTSEVYYETRGSIYDYDRDLDFYAYIWNPAWYDPWASGWYYYPGAYSPWLGYGGFGYFDWGYWGGYYGSSWYFPRYGGLYDYWYPDYYGGGYGYDAYNNRGGRHRDRYKDKYRTAHDPAPYKLKSSTLASGYAQNARRDTRLKVASRSVRSKRSVGEYKSTRVRHRGTIAKPSIAKGRDAGAYKRYYRTTRVTHSRKATRSARSSKSVRRASRAHTRSSSKPVAKSRRPTRRVSPKSRKPTRRSKAKKPSSKSRSSSRSKHRASKPRRQGSSSPKARSDRPSRSRSKPSASRGRSSRPSRSSASSSRRGGRRTGSSKASRGKHR